MSKEEKDKILEEEAVGNELYECPGCGANLKYLPEKEALHCEYCNTTISLTGKESEEEFDFLSNCDKVVDDWTGDTRIVRCQNCGGSNVIEKHAITSNCPFCNSSSVIDTDELVGEKPNRVIPFKIGKENALNIYKTWLKKRLYAPRNLKKDLPNPQVNGVYIPSWTYDANSVSVYSGRLGKHYTTTVGSGKNRRTVTKTRYFSISGTYKCDFDDVLVCSGDKLTQDVLDKLVPYNTNDSYIYDKRYLAGFSAEHYHKSLKDAWEVAKGKTKKTIEKRILNKYDYDVVSYLKVNTNYDNIQYKYVILPVWICMYKYQKKTYRFMINGETGKLVGKYPVSPIKVTFTVLIIILAILLFFIWMEN